MQRIGASSAWAETPELSVWEMVAAQFMVVCDMCSLHVSCTKSASAAVLKKSHFNVFQGLALIHLEYAEYVSAQLQL